MRRLESRASVLSPGQNFCLLATMIVFVLISMVLTAFSTDMMIYDEGNVYSCPVDHVEKSMAAAYESMHGDDEGKSYSIDPISHKLFEDMVYDPMECRPFYQDPDAPIWYGRVENMQSLN